MGNPFIPFPRCENLIIVGDTATEYLGALRIFGRGLIGGEVPSMELLHPMEKHLECVSCFLNDPTKVLLPAVRRLENPLVVLEENASVDANPATVRERLEAAGVKVQILDVRGSVEEGLRRAGALFHEEKQAERILKERTERLEALQKDIALLKPGQKVLLLLAIRSPIRHESYVFTLSTRSPLSQLLTETFQIKNVNRRDDEERIPGVQDLGHWGELLALKPDVIAYTGDAAACGQHLHQLLQNQPKLAVCPAIQQGRIYGAPYFCEPLRWKLHETLEAWSDVLKG